MKNVKSIAIAIAVIALFSLGSTVQAQLNVNPTGEVGIGTTTPNGKLHVIGTSTKIYNVYLDHDHSGTSTKYGVFNYLRNGTGFKLGQYNYTFQGTGSTSSTYGMYNIAYGRSGFVQGMYNSAYMFEDGTSGARGLYNYTYNRGSGTSYGMYNYHNSNTNATGIQYGIYNYVIDNGQAGVKYGIYSRAEGTNNYAGYFVGNVYVQGAFTQTSDERKKENIRDLDNALDIVKQLQAKTYTFKQDDEYLPAGEQFGFLAQDLEQVIPNVVKTVDAPVTASNKNADKVLTAEELEAGAVPAAAGDNGATTELKSVDYISIIPILVEAVKEQQTIIEAQQKELNALKAELKK